MITHRTVLTTGLVYLLSTGNTIAQGDEVGLADDAPWSIEIDMGVEHEPVYTGSDVYVSEADFNIELSYSPDSGHEYFVSLGEIGARWALGADRRLTTLFEYEFGRENEADSALNSFPTVQDTVEFQLAYQQRIGLFNAGVAVQHDIRNRGKGTVGFLGLAYRQNINDRLGLQLQLDLSFADAEHMNTEVGISTDTAQQTGYDTYSANSGYKGASASLRLQYAITKNLSLRTDVAVESYGSIMSESPLIKDEGSANTYEASLGVRYEL